MVPNHALLQWPRTSRLDEDSKIPALVMGFEQQKPTSSPIVLRTQSNVTSPVGMMGKCAPSRSAPNLRYKAQFTR